MPTVGYGRKWRKQRDPYLRANPWCRSCLKQGRRTPAGVVDHIVPHKGNQSLMWNSANWQSLCHYCHTLKTISDDGGLNSGASTHPEWLPVPACRVTLVTGPAGAGKSTWCRSHATASDIIIDLDECLTTVAGVHGHHAKHEYLRPALRLRNKLLASLAAKRTGRAYVIVSSPTINETKWWMNKLNADHVLLEPGLEACLERLAPGRQQFARKWYAKRASNDWASPETRRKATIGVDGWPIEVGGR